MYIATVIPLSKGPNKDMLSYFCAEMIPLGSIVTVPIRSKDVDAIVIDIEDALERKSDLKSADFQLKKITRVKGETPFTKEFFTACERMKDYSVSRTGTIIRLLMPNIFLENISLLKQPLIINQKATPENIRHEKVIFQALIADRLSWYRTLIREAFAKKESVFICVPTRYDIEIFKEALTKGIEKYVFSFHGDMGKKSLINSYNSCITEPHPVLIIGTGIYLSVPRTDIKTIIIEHESSESYKQLTRPYLDIRSFAEILSALQHSKLIFGDTLLRPDTLHRHEEGELGEVAPPLFRLPNVERQMIVDMKEEHDEKGSKKFNVISNKTRQMIQYAIENNESVFLFSVRKGLAGVTVCNDCGHTLLCPQCATPVVLYGNKQRTADKATTGRVFMCNKCGRKESTEVRCENCTSWNLTPIGIGTDRVCEEVKNLFPNAHIVQIDKESTPTEKQAREAMDAFIKKPGSILVGNEMAFSYIRTKVIHSAIISLDGLLSIPSFSITQKILHIIEKLHYITERNLIIQTRIPENRILEYILSGNVLPLYREDLRERKEFGYPPFKRLIKITFTGTATESEKARTYLDMVLEKYDPQIFSAFVGKIKGHYITNTVIKTDPKEWLLPIRHKNPEQSDLLSILRTIPLSFSINVDPEDLL